MPTPDDYHELAKYFEQHHPELTRWHWEDVKTSARLFKSFSMIFGRAEDMPTSAISHEGFALTVMQTALASGVQRKDKEPVENWLNRIFRGKQVVIAGARFGTLNKMFSVFGAKAYGVDTNSDAIKICQERGIDAKRADVKNIENAYPKRRPDFFVSYHFFDPNFWEKMQDELKEVQTGMKEHSTDETIHVHICANGLTAFPGFREIKRKNGPMHISVMRKK